MQMIPVTQLRKDIFDIIDNVSTGRIYNITEKGKARAVLISSEEFESWQETLDVLHDIPDLEKDIKKLRKDMQTGKHLQYKTLESLTSHRVDDKLSNKRNGKSRKRISQTA